MKALKFVCNDEHQKQFAAAIRKNVSDYFQKNDISIKGNSALVIQTIVMLLLYLVPFWILFTVHVNDWLALLLVILMGMGMAGIGMCVMHDAVHGSYSGNEWLNKFLGGTLYLLGSNLYNWKIQHNILHHAYTNIEGYDRDIESRGPIRLSQYAPLRRIHYYQHIHAFFFYGLMTISKLIRDFTQMIEFNREGLTGKNLHNPAMEYVKMLILKILYLFIFLVLPVMITDYKWWQVLIGFFIMHWVAGCILTTIFQMAHVVEGASQTLPDNDGVIRKDWVVHQLETTSDFARKNLFLNWYVGGLNFQIEHHLFPNICHIHYKKIAPIVEQTAKEYGYVYNLKPTFMDALSSHIKRLKVLGRKN